MSPFLDRVRTSAEFVRSRAKHVSVCPSAVTELASRMKSTLETTDISVHKIWNDCPLNPVWGESRAGIESVEDICFWIFCIDCINFSFWHNEGEERWTIWYKDKQYTGYFALCAAFNQAVENGSKDILSTTFLKCVSEPQLKFLLMPQNSQGVIPLLSERVLCLREAGHVLEEYFGGSVFRLVLECNGSLETLVQKVVEYFPSFRDEAIYQKQKVFFYKRAQIFAADIFACLGQSALSFKDPDCLTMFADYRVPQILYKWGVLKYSNTLVSQLLQQLEIEQEQEVEIRACSIAAVEMIRNEIQQSNPELFVTSQLIDYLLWNEAMTVKSCGQLDNIPFHRVRTIFY